MKLVRALQQVKHQGFLASKRLAFLRDELRDTAYRTASRLRPYEYDPARYPLDFVTLPSDYADDIQIDIPRRIWCVWFGGAKMSTNRQAAFDSIRRTQSDLEVTLVTEDNLGDYLVQGAPLNDSFERLSAVHRSDYLHAYLMHHHGGAFTGIKKHHHPWAPVFSRIDSDPDAWVIGYRLARVREATYFHGPLADDVHLHYARLPGFSGKIVRARSRLTHEWFREVDRRVDYYADLLARAPGNLYGDNPGYPVPWTRLGSQVFEPLCLKYNEHVRIDPRLKPQLWGHR